MPCPSIWLAYRPQVGSSDRLDIQTVAALRVAEASAAVNNYCDHAEHNEVVEREWVTGAGHRMRLIAALLARVHGFEIGDLYADRLMMVEAKNVHFVAGESFDGGAAALQTETWRDLQLCQIAHDRVYHPDVIGLTRCEQLRHYAFHVAKIAGSFAAVALAWDSDGLDDLLTRRLPDTMLFGVKLSTAMSERLSDIEGPRTLALGSDGPQSHALLAV